MPEYIVYLDSGIFIETNEEWTDQEITDEAARLLIQGLSENESQGYDWQIEVETP